MIAWKSIFLLMILPLSLAWGNCDPTHFRWECDIPVRFQPQKNAHSLIYCGNTPLYVTKREYACIARYQRDNINLTLNINGEYIDSPCIPAGRYGPQMF